jgi:hypothetical protein
MIAQGAALYAQFLVLAGRLAQLAPEHQEGVNLGSWVALVAAARQSVRRMPMRSFPLRSLTYSMATSAAVADAGE